MNSNNFVTIVCTIITVVSSVTAIFLSNYLGRSFYWAKIRSNTNRKRYDNLYLPIIQKLYAYDPFGLDYEHVQDQKVIFDSFNYQEYGQINGDQRNPFVSLIMDHIKYASPELIQRCHEFIPVSDTYDGKSNPKNIDNDKMQLANKRFYCMIKQSLKDSKIISKSIMEEDLTRMLMKDLNNPHRKA